MKKDNIAHNNPPLELEDFIIKDRDGKSTGRIKFTNTFLKKYLTKKYIPERDEYVERVINDSEKIGLKAKATVGGSISLFYQYLPKGKNYQVKYLLGKFPFEFRWNLFSDREWQWKIRETKVGFSSTLVHSYWYPTDSHEIT